jgi:hypothetical protein
MNNTASKTDKNRVLNHISIPDLIACLKLHYQGQLDDVAYDILPRLYLSLNQLDPSNSLFGQITSADLSAALSRIDIKFTNAIEYLITGRESLRPILESDYVKIDQPFNFDEFLMLRSKYCMYLLTEFIQKRL